MRPLNGFIVVEMLDPTKTAGGILLVDNNKPFKKGKVISVGDGSYQRQGSDNFLEMEVKAGDVVYFNTGNILEIDHYAKQVLLHYTNLLGIEE